MARVDRQKADREERERQYIQMEEPQRASQVEERRGEHHGEHDQRDVPAFLGRAPLAASSPPQDVWPGPDPSDDSRASAVDGRPHDLLVAAEIRDDPKRLLSTEPENLGTDFAASAFTAPDRSRVEYGRGPLRTDRITGRHDVVGLRAEGDRIAAGARSRGRQHEAGKRKHEAKPQPHSAQGSRGSPRPTLGSVLADEIREKWLSFFEEAGHLRVPSSSLVPPSYDPSVLLTTAGMQQFKPYFRGEEKPPSNHLTSCQKCFRTVDIDVVGTTKRHLTFFEMLGNFSIGDYFKQGAVEYATEFSTKILGLDFDRIWITVFGGDEELGLGPDEEAIACWKAVGVPDERIVQLGRDDNFWQAGPTGPCGPCSELYYDRGPEFGDDEDRPGDDTDRVVEYWNLVFMQYELHDDGRLTPLPAQNIDTGLGIDRMAAILQDVPSVFETEHFRPMVELGEQLSGHKYGEDDRVTRALRILSDHGRGMTFLLSDGVVPSNEERGYVLRRIMRRAVQQGQVLGIEESFLPRLADTVIEVMDEAYPDLRRNADTIHRWAASEEAGFRRTLDQGERLLDEVIKRAREDGTSWIAAEDAFKLHDTYGFPYELTKELLAEEGLAVDDQGFEELMEQARDVARRGMRK